MFTVDSTEWNWKTFQSVCYNFYIEDNNLYVTYMLMAILYPIPKFITSPINTDICTLYIWYYCPHSSNRYAFNHQLLLDQGISLFSRSLFSPRLPDILAGTNLPVPQQVLLVCSLLFSSYVDTTLLTWFPMHPTKSCLMSQLMLSSCSLPLVLCRFIYLVAYSTLRWAFLVCLHWSN